ncbi:hypothetical protein [Vibrio sp. Isolate30]|uniref:hypothetical protein n=1 Tax=Vibrio sp. Isolate30 TaxID=2908536 RepID=UPI001EFDF6C8|nr:hypothetical protein [Vibrio sp. Isolate30]MCG9632756.1 hypothetical protein [Vibrio sp. Isolate30]
MNQDYQITAQVQAITTTFFQSSHKTNVINSNKDQKRSQYQFPMASEENDSIICEYQRVIKIYNKCNNDARKKLTVKMEQWFLGEAKRCGWADAKFFKCAGSTKKACFLVKQIELESIYASKH